MGVGEHEGGGGEAHHEPSIWEKLLGWGNAAVHTVAGAGESVIQGAISGSGPLAKFGNTVGKPFVHGVEHAAEWGLEHLGVGSKTASGIAGKLLPGIGTAIGLGQFGYHSHEAANTADNGNWTGNEHWNHTGEATLGAAGAAASWCPPAALYLGAGELATDIVGGGAGLLGQGINSLFGTHLDLGFNAGSVVGGIEHAADAGQSWLHNKILPSAENHPILHGIGNAALNGLEMACPLTAPLALYANMGSVVTGAGHAIDAVGSGISSVAHKAWDALPGW